jgi:hypothetical protein
MLKLSHLDYKQQDQVIRHPYNGSTELIIEPIGPSVAQIYFQHAPSGTQLPIPDTVSLYDDTHKCLIIPHKETFYIHLMNNYTLYKHCHETYLKIEFIRQQSITCSFNLHTS